MPCSVQANRCAICAGWNMVVSPEDCQWCVGVGVSSGGRRLLADFECGAVAVAGGQARRDGVLVPLGYGQEIASPGLVRQSCRPPP
jgi:hypothetical protein